MVALCVSVLHRVDFLSLPAGVAFECSECFEYLRPLRTSMLGQRRCGGRRVYFLCTYDHVRS